TEQGMAAGLVNASIQIGAAIGLATVTAVVTASTGAGSTAASQLAGYRPGLAAALGISVLGLLIVVVIAMLGWRARISMSGGTPAFALASLTVEGLTGSVPPDSATPAASVPLADEMEQ
ncbi:MAG: hypothetical protein ACRDN0_08090, partial [Trebonia sp.]